MGSKMKNHNQFVRCLENIQDLSGQKLYSYALVLGGGGIFTRKTIKYDPKARRYYVTNRLDNTKEVLTKNALLKSNIGKGMIKRALIAVID